MEELYFLLGVLPEAWNSVSASIGAEAVWFLDNGHTLRSGRGGREAARWLVSVVKQRKRKLLSRPATFRILSDRKSSVVTKAWERILVTLQFVKETYFIC